MLDCSADSTDLPSNGRRLENIGLKLKRHNRHPARGGFPISRTLVVWSA